MEKNIPSPENSPKGFTEKDSLTYVPRNLFRIMIKFGPFCALNIAINRLRFRVMCRVLYSVDLLRTCQIHYNQLRCSAVTRYLVRKSMQSYVLSTLIWKIEHHFRKEYFVKDINPRSSKLFQDMLKKQNTFVSF